MTFTEIAETAVNGKVAMQKPSELAELLKVVNYINPKIIVEIGSFRGGTLWAYRQVCSNARIISIDTGVLDRTVFPLQDVCKSINAELLQMDSQLEGTRNALVQLLGNDKIDFLMLDAWHSYESVKREFELYSPLMNKKGFVVLHDIVPHPAHGIAKFWEELKQNYANREEIVLNPEYARNPHVWGGFGIIYF